MRRILATLLTASALGLAAPASAQLPAGIDAQSMIGGPISVPAGETTTVDLGIPVSASYSGNGWNVVSAGSAVTVTAPASGTANVPVSAAGQSASITLIAEEGAAPIAVPTQELQELQSEASSGAASGTPSAGGAAGDAANPGDVDRSAAEQIHLDSTIEGNQIIAKLSLSQAMSLYNQFGNTSTEGMKLRYLDVNGTEIKGIKREIDKGSRTLTLTYPEGKTPDNPFIMEAVRDGASVAVVTLTDSAQPVTTPTDAAKSPSQPATVAADSGNKKIGLYAIAGVIALLVFVGIITTIVRRFSRRK
ncbi:hypothetical protein WG915_11050 [Corynebacterium sp. H128]|uniref:hypothetical protein n=1 Tax=unclassified Corynebacterium TaxID=2624378 RepID=UPI0030ADB710